MSILKGAISNLQQKYTANTEQQQFDSFINKMIEAPVYSMGMYLKQLEGQAANAGATGWKSFLPGSMKNPSSEMALKQVEMMKALQQNISDESEMKSMRHPVKSKIAAQGGGDVSSVNSLVRSYLMSKSMHEWLHERKNKGIRLPKDNKELASMMAESPVKYPKEVMTYLKRIYKKQARNTMN